MRTRLTSGAAGTPALVERRTALMERRTPALTVRRAALVLLMMLLTTASAWAQDAITGLTYNTAGGYYEISDEAALNAHRTYVNGGHNASGKTFRQTANITLTQNFTPISYNKSSNNQSKFSGTYDGGGKTISGLTITGNNACGYTDFQALFGSVENATIRNLTLSGASITGDTYVGAFVGYSWGGLTMTNCHAVNCTVSGYDYVGIFVGYLNNPASTIKACTATGGSVSGNSNVGAIVGSSYGMTTNLHKIVGCVGRITGGADLVGENSNTSAEIIASYGVNAYTITAGTGVTITYSAVSNNYSDVIHPPYINAGETVPVTLSYTGSLSNVTFLATGATLNDACTELYNAQGNVTINATQAQKTDISGGPKRSNKRVKISSTIVGNHTYAVSSGWTWATLAAKNAKALALDPTPSAPGEEPVVTAVRIVSLDPKAKKAGGLAVALKGVIVRPNDEVDAEKEYGLVTYSESE